MIVRQFLQWVRQAPARERAEATSALARAYLYSDLSADDLAAAEGAMIMLLDDPSPLVRRALAQVFDDLGIEWRYEPRTFPLEWRDGVLVEACTPDFYLPELDMYVECTVMKQRLVHNAHGDLSLRIGVGDQQPFFNE